MVRRAVPRGDSGAEPLRGGRGAGPLGADRGFTLIEIVVAMLVLSFAVLGMASILAGTSRRHERSVSHGELTAAAESKFEDLRSAAAAGGADTVELAPGGSLVENEDDHADSLLTSHNRWLRRRWVVAEGPAQTRAVTVRVEPVGGALNDHRAVAFRSLVLRP